MNMSNVEIWRQSNNTEYQKCDLCGKYSGDTTLSLGQYVCSKCEDTFNIYYSIEDSRVFRKKEQI